MKTLFSVALAATLLLAFAPVVRAQDEDGAVVEGPVKVTEADYATYRKIRYAQELAGARAMFSGGDAAKRKRHDDEARDAHQTAGGWTLERFDAVRNGLQEALGCLRELDTATGEDAAAWKESLAALDPATVATTKAHRKELEDESDLRTKAEQQVRDERDAERRGTPPDAKTLEGTWTLDADASADAGAAMVPEGPSRKELREKLKAALVQKVTYVFGPGAKFEARTVEKDGRERLEKGTYRLEGSKILFTVEGSGKERSLEAGMKGGCLHVSMFGAAVVFKKQK